MRALRPPALAVAVLVVFGLCTAPAAVAAAPGSVAPGSAASGSVAPGAPGATADWLPSDKQGFGTSTTPASKVWFTLERGALSEVYYPRIDTPSVRDLQFVVTDGTTFAQQERDSTTQEAVLGDPHSLVYRQINTDVHGRWRLTKTTITDPRTSTVVIHVRFESLTGRPYHVYVLADPQLSNATDPESGTCPPASMVATDAHMGSAVLTSPALQATSCGYRGTSDGWLDISRHFALTQHYASAPNGNITQTGMTSLTGVGRRQTLTLALGFGTRAAGALAGARSALAEGWPALVRAYRDGWHGYLATLNAPPRSLTSAAERREYRVSTMVLAASEDKTYRGAYVASPTMPWAWGTGLQKPSGPYHLVWPRDLYEIATGLIADGDVAGARRALHFLFDRQQKPDGSFPQNSDVTGVPVWTSLQLDEVADPIILAWQLRSFGPASWSHVKRAADFIVGWHDDQGHTAPRTLEERWENQAGYSPATIATEIAGLVCAADIARRNGDTASERLYLRTADAWRAHVNAWTVTTTGPYASAYYLRLTKDGNPNAGTTYSIGDSGPAAIDQRDVVDPSFLELVRLGVVSASDPTIASTIHVVDAQLSDVTPSGQFWHRYTDDGYGEQRNGDEWNVGFPAGSQTTIGRLWPIFAGERGEYELLAGTSAGPRLSAMAAAANTGELLPEQVWDQNPPSGTPGFPPGHPTFSATPLAWTHAQFIRLAWSIAAGRPVEQPSIVACRYIGQCAPS